MTTINETIDFTAALRNKTDQQFEMRQVIPNAFVKKALAAGRAHDEKINQAIFNFEVARAAWRCKNNSK